MCRGAKYRYQHMPTMAINSHVYNLNTFVYFLKNIINLVNVDDTSDRIDHVRFGRACHFKSEDARGGAMHQYGGCADACRSTSWWPIRRNITARRRARHATDAVVRWRRVVARN